MVEIDDNDEQEWDDNEDHAAVDIPKLNSSGNIDEEWINIATFPTKADAIKWAQVYLGADADGMICVINTF